MTRKAILIASDKSKHGELPGALVDLTIHRSYLRSSLGGAWEENEIKTLRNPTLAEVQEALSAAQNVEYAFVTFSGHGEHVVGKSLNETRLFLNDNEVMSVIAMNPRTQRHVVIVDACRKVRPITESIRKGAETAFANEALKLDRGACRQLFDDGVQNAEIGRCVMYSCQVNQTAGEDKQRGGTFTEALINSSLSLSIPPFANTATLSLDQAFQAAKTETYRVNAPQTAEWEPGRRRYHFPYAVMTK